MIKRDVTKSAVIIIIAVNMGAMFATATPETYSLSGVRTIPPPREWGWENVTEVVTDDIFVGYGETVEIRNSTIEMDSSEGTIGIRVLGLLLVKDSIIRSHGEDGYYFEVFGGTEIEDSTIQDVISINPIGVGMMVNAMHFRARRSTLQALDSHAITFYTPYITAEDFFVESDVDGIMMVKSYVNARNSTLGALYFKLLQGEFHLWNCTYSSASASPAAFGFIYSWRYLQVHTSLPEADLEITSVDGYQHDETTTDDEGNFRMWYISKWSIVDPIVGMIDFDNNPLTFEARKTVVRELRMSFRGVQVTIGMCQEHYGKAVQDIEDDPSVEIVLRPAL
jgi:hypothetical protein